MTDPHIVKKFNLMLDELNRMNANYEVKRNVLKSQLANKFRLTADDVDIALKEQEAQKRIRRVNRDKVQF